MPRAAILSVHARVEGTGPDVLDDPSLVQVWGPRFSAYAVAAQDRAVFTVGRLPDDPEARQRVHELADRLESVLDGGSMPYGQAGRALGEPPNRLRYAALTGRVLIRWDGARQPTVATVPLPDVDPSGARLELARRHLHVFGPSTPRAFGAWAGIRPPAARAAFDALRRSLTPVTTPAGEGWILARDQEAFLTPPGAEAPARLLPSGDAYYLLQGDDRRLLVTDQRRRADLWTSRVWPGAVLVGGEIVGTWRRAQHRVTVQVWHPLPRPAREAVEAEATSLPLPGLDRPITIRWED